MTVYVDDMRRPLRRMIMCHMLADTPEELHGMADRIGVHRRWFQGKASTPHYDICQSKRTLAIRYGAEEITMKEAGRMASRIRKQWRETR